MKRQTPLPPLGVTDFQKYYQESKEKILNSRVISFKFVTLNGIKTKIYRGYD